MAAKSLSSVVGGGGQNIGDLIATRASALADGKVLLPCDGSAFNTTTYSQLAAVIAATRGLGPVRYWRGVDNLRMVNAHHFAVSPDGTQCLGISNQNFITVAVGGGGALIGDAGFDSDNPGLADDHSGQCFFATEANKGFIKVEITPRDITFTYSTTDNGAFPTTDRVIDTTLIHDSNELVREVPCFGSIVYTANLQEAIICDVDGSDTVRCYYGTNAGGFWADTSWTVGAASTETVPEGYLLGYGVSNPDLSKSFWPTSRGIYVSTDTGATWATQAKLLPTNQNAVALAINSTEDVFAVGDRYDLVAKSTDDGVNWTTVLERDDILIIMPEGFGPIRFRDVKIDSSNRVYVLADANNGQYTVAILYVSTDGGTTWTYMVQPIVEPAAVITEVISSGASYDEYKNDPRLSASASGDADETKATAEFLRMQLESDGSTLYVNDQRRFTVYEAAITAGSFLPYLPGYKIVADAP